MSKWTLPVAFVMITVGLKLLFVLGVRFASEDVPEWVFTVVRADPVPLWLALRATQVGAPVHRLGPGPFEGGLFDVVLLISTGIQWCLIGLLVWRISRSFRRRTTPQRP
jgi:hypothetical protein